MATQLKDLKFNDYTARFEQKTGGGFSMHLGSSDSITIPNSGGDGADTLIGYYDQYGWVFNGTAVNAQAAEGIQRGGENVLDKTGSTGTTEEKWSFFGTSAKALKVGSANGSSLYYDYGCSGWILKCSAIQGPGGGSVVWIAGGEGGSGSWTFNGVANVSNYTKGLTVDGQGSYTLSVDQNGFVKATFEQ